MRPRQKRRIAGMVVGCLAALFAACAGSGLYTWNDKYLLNVSRIEKNEIARLQTWLIVPKNELWLLPLT
ncbi:MAG: hypothetical protein HFI39_01535 [Lachnospiraceae bacterium]|nr:hypothetical protein [Lachnospiraceae bacterium]